MHAFLNTHRILPLMTVALLMSLLGVLGKPPGVAYAATFTVTNCNDTMPVSPGSLREAINNANAHSGSTITFNIPGSCTITLTSGPLVINANMTLDASGSPQPVTISGNHKVQVFQVHSGVTFTLNTLSIVDGNGAEGGGIFNNGGTLTISNSTFANNSAAYGDGGGIYNHRGTVTISNSTISNNSAYSGGGIFNDVSGTVNISNSIISSNTGPSSGFYDDGGGIYNHGTMNISNSIISSNSINFGGGIFNGFGGKVSISQSTVANNSSASDGGGIYNGDNVTMTISQSTVANNSSASGTGGGIWNAGPMTITNSTIANNSAPSGGGGLVNSFNVTVTITNSTIANNSAPSGGIDNVSGTVSIAQSIVANNRSSNCAGPITDQGYNLESGTDCSFGGATDLQHTDPLLDPAGLRDNGGPTLTIALQPGSPALDRIPLASCLVTTDQRGMSRPQGPACDMGAFELGPPLTLHLPGTITVDETSPQGATVTYTVTATDPPYPPEQLTITCTPPSGSTFPIGTTTVHCTATNPAGHTTTGSFAILVQKTSAPILHLPSPITVDATSAQGTTVAYTVTATDAIYPPEQLTITCTPASGSMFPIGTTTVVCRVTDPVGNTSTGSFAITVQNKLSPVLHLPDPITVDATSAQGAVVTYAVTATDPVYPPDQLTIRCMPSSGSTFPIGMTTVHCSATNPAGNSATGSFRVTVQNTFPPVLHLPETVTVHATDPQGAAAFYTVTATDPVYPESQIVILCTPPSGSTFPIGTTTVNCTATNPAGNTATGSFQVIVQPLPRPDLTLQLKHAGKDHFRRGNVIPYRIEVRNREHAGPVTTPNTIRVTLVIPVGLRHLHARGENWQIILTSTTSPALLTAVYQGTYPVEPGAHLPPLVVQGQFNQQAIPRLTLAASVNVPGDENALDTMAYDTVQVVAPDQQQSPCQQRNHCVCRSCHQKKLYPIHGHSVGGGLSGGGLSSQALSPSRNPGLPNTGSNPMETITVRTTDHVYDGNDGNVVSIPRHS